MPLLNNHVNVHGSCVALLLQRGWRVRIVPGPYEEEDSRLDTYEAKRDGTTLLASTPLELLGLSELHVHHHPHDERSYWWWIEPPAGALDQLEADALELAFDEYRQRDESGWRRVVGAAVAAAHADPECSAADRLGVSEETLQRVLREFPELSPE